MVQSGPLVVRLDHGEINGSVPKGKENWFDFMSALRIASLLKLTQILILPTQGHNDAFYGGCSWYTTSLPHNHLSEWCTTLMLVNAKSLD